MYLVKLGFVSCLLATLFVDSLRVNKHRYLSTCAAGSKAHNTLSLTRFGLKGKKNVLNDLKNFTGLSLFRAGVCTCSFHHDFFFLNKIKLDNEID